MKYQNIGSVAGTSLSEVFEVKNFSDGYGVQVNCSASNTPNISVYESVGKHVASEGVTAPTTGEAQYWAQIDTSGVASGTESYFLNREHFRGKYVYVDITATSMSDAEILFNTKD